MKKVMIVDDEESIRQTAKLILEEEGYDISESLNADECWLTIQKNKPDLILLDIRLPGMSALDLVRKIKEDPKLRKIRIVYLTAIKGTKEFTKKVEGVIDAIEKPFKNEELISVVKNALSYEVL